jgi:NTP pyrophosphatase (non-canonical NTP hydrolase)
MEIEELQDFIDWEIKRLNIFTNKTNEELKPWSAVKLGEEVGELQEQVIGNSGIQRKEKADKFSKENLGEEFADVIITACILARRHNVDIVDALTKKIEVIRGRDY